MESNTNWLDSIKSRFSGQEPWAVELVIFGLGGFVTGFLIKNFGKLVVMVIGVSLIAILLLHYTHIYEMPYEQLQSLLGISDQHSLTDIVTEKITWGQGHPVALIAAIVGGLVGWKVG